jgi:hypothetical protein
MAVISWPYVSIDGDRDVTASDEAQGYDLFVASGVVPGIRDELGVTKVSGALQVSIGAGAAIIAGRRYMQDEAITLTVDAGDAQPRIDIIALESNANTPVRAAQFVVIKGTPAASPTAPELTVTDAVVQQAYARLTIPASAQNLNSATLTNVREYATGRHSHDIANVMGLQTEINSLQSAINGKANTSHTHTIANVTNLQTTLNGKAESSHTHTIANVTSLQTTLNGKSNTTHTHNALYYTESEIDTKLNGKANSSHTHTISNVTGLQTALNGKQDSLDSDRRRKITISTSNPSGGSNGDIWLKY